MGRKKSGQSQSSYTYFKKLFSENPQLVHEKSNDKIVAQYRTDHGIGEDAEIDKSVKNNLANLKSNLRKKGRDAQAVKAGRPTKSATAVATAVNSGGRGLETLEEHIDDCLSMAKHLDTTGLHEVIAHLRRARNLVVWKIGQ